MKKIRCYVMMSLAFCLASLFGGPLFAEDSEGGRTENEVYAIGSGRIVKGNLALGKRRALEAASAKGLEVYLFRRLGGQGMVNHFQRIVQEIIPKTADVYENFNILAEEQTAERYQILVRFHINEKVMDEALREAGVVHLEGPPVKVLFLVSESIEGEVYFWWKDPEPGVSLCRSELALYKVFQERGFDPINRTLAAPEGEVPETLRKADLEDVEIVTWGRFFSADVVMYGQVEVLIEEEAYLTLKAVDVREGGNIGQAFQVGTIERDGGGEPLITETLEKLVSRLASRLVPSVMQRVATERGKIHQVDITLVGLTSYSQFRDIKNFLQTHVRGIRSLRPARVRHNAITVRVDYQGDREKLLGTILGGEKLPVALKAEPSTSEGGITLRAP